MQFHFRVIFSVNYNHCVKSVPIRSYSGPHFPAFGLNTERYEVRTFFTQRVFLKVSQNPQENIFVGNSFLIKWQALDLQLY